MRSLSPYLLKTYPTRLKFNYCKNNRGPTRMLKINADAHKAEDLVGHFDRARALAAEAGYSELVRFHQRRRYAYPLFADRTGGEGNESPETYLHQVDSAREFAKKWDQAGPALEEIRFRQLHELSDETARKMMLDLCDMWRPREFDDLGSGMMERQRILAKLRESKL
jgi:hypothetical protein